MVANFLDVFRNEAQGKGVEVESDLVPALVAAIDVDLMRQVLWNLARNAAEAVSGPPDSSARGKLTFMTRENGDWVEILVKDNGPGVPEEIQRRIFDPFFTTKRQGTGLGLAIAHSIMDSHHGKVLVSSAPNEGTTFTLRLPRRAVVRASYDDMDAGLDETPSNFEILGGPV
jgi:signal transduction histidine kinase